MQISRELHENSVNRCCRGQHRCKQLMVFRKVMWSGGGIPPVPSALLCVCVTLCVHAQVVVVVVEVEVWGGGGCYSANGILKHS